MTNLTPAAMPLSSRRKDLRALVRSPGLMIWCLFLLFSPLYIAPSGLPQPSDALVFLLVPLSFAGWDRRLDPSANRTLRALFWFTAWVAVVNYGWALVLWKWDNLKDFVIHPLFYAFNLAVFASALMLIRRDRGLFLRMSVAVVYLSIGVQVVASFFYRTDLYRGELFFNSPNQLGYYALLAACMFAMTQRPLGISRLRAGLGVTGCAYLALLSASRASLAGVLVLLVVLLFSNPRTIILASLAAAGLLTLGGPLANAIDAAQHRATHRNNPNITFAEERGYDRIWQYPEYLPIGAGEGVYQRFAKEGERGRELHSSFGSVLFGYGLVGVTLFLVFFVRVIKGSTRRTALMLVPALLYTIAHQGLRFTMFWVVLAVFVGLKQGPPRATSAAAPKSTT